MCVGDFLKMDEHSSKMRTFFTIRGALPPYLRTVFIQMDHKMSAKTGCGMDNKGSIPCRATIFHFATKYRPKLVHSQPASHVKLTARLQQAARYKMRGYLCPHSLCSLRSRVKARKVISTFICMTLQPGAPTVVVFEKVRYYYVTSKGNSNHDQRILPESI